MNIWEEDLIPLISGFVRLVDRGEGEKKREEERTAYYAVVPWQTLCEVDVVSFHF